MHSHANRNGGIQLTPRPPAQGKRWHWQESVECPIDHMIFILWLSFEASWTWSDEWSPKHQRRGVWRIMKLNVWNWLTIRVNSEPNLPQTVAWIGQVPTIHHGHTVTANPSEIMVLFNAEVTLTLLNGVHFVQEVRCKYMLTLQIVHFYSLLHFSSLCSKHLAKFKIKIT